MPRYRPVTPSRFTILRASRTNPCFASSVATYKASNARKLHDKIIYSNQTARKNKKTQENYTPQIICTAHHTNNSWAALIFIVVTCLFIFLWLTYGKTSHNCYDLYNKSSATAEDGRPYESSRLCLHRRCVEYLATGNFYLLA